MDDAIYELRRLVSRDASVLPMRAKKLMEDE
jgi:hypothetical protein